MSNIYEQKFYSALKDTFIGHPIKGKSGYVNLMDIKANYFAEIEPYIKDEIDKKIKPKFREELFEKLFNFFDCYLNETGTVFFANSQIHKNLYEKVYSDREDVSLFWKTQKLYYVKSEANYEDLQTEVNGINILFDASEIKHAKGNEKKTIEFYLIKATKKEVVFKIRYKEQNKYDRLREYLDLKKTADIQDKLIENYSEDIHPNIYFEDTTLDFEVFARVTDARKNIYFEDIEDALNSVKIEYSISDLDLMLQYLQKKGIILYSEDVKKIFSIYKRQNEIDYFIHKDAEGFLKEQFDIYVYNWLFNDLETDFDAPTVQRMQDIKKIAHKVIEYIARFEDELKAIWEKPKFVKNCNYVLTLDKLANNVPLIQKLMDNDGWKNQVEDWQELYKEWTDEKGETTKKVWKEFEFADLKDFEKNIINNKKLNEEYQYLPIDTKFFPKLRIEILSVFQDLKNDLDGNIIKTDNWQGLNTIKHKFHNQLDLIYIDPPFNTGSDFKYKDQYQDSTWLSLICDRLLITKELLNRSGTFYFHIDYRANFLARLLLDKIFGKDNFLNEIIYGYRIQGIKRNAYANKHDTIFSYTKSRPDLNLHKFHTEKERQIYKKPFIDTVAIPPDFSKVTEKDRASILKALENNKALNDKFKDKIFNKYYSETFIRDVWDHDKTKPLISGSSEYLKFQTQKSEGLLSRIIENSSDVGDTVLDFFSGSGTTISTAHKLKRKWLAMEMGEHFNGTNIPRLKWTLIGNDIGISKDVNFKGGGFFKYYELEQYEEVLAKAKYQWQSGKNETQVEKYSFLQDEKLLDAIEVDYKEKNAKVVFENLYPNIDIGETLSNVSGKHIKQIFEDKVIFEDDIEVVYAEMTFEKYPWIKPLIWWNSK
jgi:adenine specific DNA methylase Mod